MLYATLLSPQGKYRYDFFVMEKDDILYLDTEKDRIPDLIRQLMLYRLRAVVDIVDSSENFTILASPNPDPQAMFCAADPRHPAMGFRMIYPAAPATDQNTDDTAYDKTRLGLGLPDGVRDMDVDNIFILEANMAELNAIDFEKGCYVGQEMTARMNYRATLKKRLLPVTVNGPLPPRGTAITTKEGQTIGDMRSGRGDRGIGYFRLDRMVFDVPYACGDATVTPRKPFFITDQIMENIS